MSELGESLKATIRLAIGRAGVTKAAGPTVEQVVYEAVIDQLCDCLGLVDENLKYGNTVLRAIAYPELQPQRVVDFRADQWHVGLVPGKASRPVNGNGNGHHRGHDLGSSNDGSGG